METLLHYKNLSVLPLTERYRLSFARLLYDSQSLDRQSLGEALAAPLYNYNLRVHGDDSKIGLATVGTLRHNNQAALLLLDEQRQHDPNEGSWRFDDSSARHWRSGIFVRIGIVIPEFVANQ